MIKYLVVLEGEENELFNTESEAIRYIESKAREMKERGVLETGKWVNDFKAVGHSNRYTSFPEFILPIDVDDFVKKLLTT